MSTKQLRLSFSSKRKEPSHSIEVNEHNLAMKLIKIRKIN